MSARRYPPTALTCLLHEVEGGCCVVIAGELDLSNIQVFRAQIDAALGGHGGIILDLQKLRYMDSTGVNAFLEVYRSLSLRNRCLALAGPAQMVRRILGVLNVGQIIPIFDTVEEAVAYLRGNEHRKPPSAGAGA